MTMDAGWTTGNITTSIVWGSFCVLASACSQFGFGLQEKQIVVEAAEIKMMLKK